MSTLLIGLPLLGVPGMWEWIVIGLAIMLLFGASKLPKLGRGLGEGIRNFKKGIKGELGGELEDGDEDSTPVKQMEEETHSGN